MLNWVNHDEHLESSNKQEFQMQFKAPRGTTDILPEERPYWRLVESMAEKISENFGYSRIDTPIFETLDFS